MAEPQSPATVATAFADLPALIPLDQRVTACILGMAVLQEHATAPSASRKHLGSH
jgi:hypothetical protein